MDQCEEGEEEEHLTPAILAAFASVARRAPVRLPLSEDEPNPLHVLHGWDGTPTGGRGTVYATDGTVTTAYRA